MYHGKAVLHDCCPVTLVEAHEIILILILALTLTLTLTRTAILISLTHASSRAFLSLRH